MGETALDRLPDATHLKPDKEFVEALMNVYRFGQWQPSDARRAGEELSVTTREGCVHRIPGDFWPPQRLSPRRENLPITVGRYWREFADYILREAQQRELTNETLDAVLKAVGAKAVKRLRGGFSIQDRANIYMDVETAADGTSAEIVEEVQGVVDALRKRMQKAVSRVLSDGRFMAQIQKTIEVATAMDTKIVFPQIVHWLDQIRADVEKPGDAEQFLSVMRQAIGILGYAESVSVDLLPTDVAFLRGCDGLYTPRQEDRKATINLPMSVYGTSKLVPLDQAFETLAHELAHHQMAEPSVEDQAIIAAYERETAAGQHGEEHNALSEIFTQRNLKVLRSLAIGVEQRDGGGGYRVAVGRSEMPGVDPDLLRATVQGLVARHIDLEEPRRGLQVIGGSGMERGSGGGFKAWFTRRFR